MTHTYSDIIRLDSERTPGNWDCDAEYSKGVIPPINPKAKTIAVMASGDGCGDICYLNNNINGDFALANAQYIAAMPDAVGLLKAYHGALIYAIAKLESANQFNDGLGLEFAISKLRQLLEEEQKP